VRLSRANLALRVNANLRFRYQATGLTSFSGLELMRQYINGLDFRCWVRERLGSRFNGNDFSATSMVMLLLGLIIGGGRRVHHIGYLKGDPVVARFCGLARLPSTRTVGRWLASFDPLRLEALRSINSRLFADILHGSGRHSLTLDVDGSVVSTGLLVKGAARGYNPHRRKVPSYYPITAYAAELGQIARVENRPGNIHDGNASLDFLGRLFDQLRHQTDSGLQLRFRMDSAFFRNDVIELLTSEEAEFAIKVPFWNHLGLKDQVAARQRWRPVNSEVSYFETTISVTPWAEVIPVVIYRQRVRHQTHKNYQLDLFDPDDGYYEYSAIASNMTMQGNALWWFMCGRGGHEQAYGELKNGFAFDCIPSMQHDANSAWQFLSVLAFNLTRAFQVATNAPLRTANGKGTSQYRFEHIRTLRFKMFNRAGMITRPKGKATIDVGSSPNVAALFKSIGQKLDIAA
jgi:hypothetical protein